MSSTLQAISVALGAMMPDPPADPGAITLSDQAMSDSAYDWVKGSLKTSTVLKSASTITLAPPAYLDSDHYPEDYTGSIEGVFNLSPEVNLAITDDRVISVTTNGGVIEGEYRGQVSGRVLLTPEPWRWIIQAYKLTESGSVQVPVQALADGSTGDFTIDLTSVSESYTGKWQLGILDANESYVPTGLKWPAGARYPYAEVRLYSVTDSTYFWSKVDARVGGEFFFENSTPGTKLVRLINLLTEEVLAEYVKPTGLVRSYTFAPGEQGYGTARDQQCFVYDQGLAIFAALSRNDFETASLMVRGLVLMQTIEGDRAGGFKLAVPQMSPSYGDPLYRIGSHAVAVDALLAYCSLARYYNLEVTGIARNSALLGCQFIRGALSDSPESAGLYRGGYSEYQGDILAEDAVIDWCSTEHNLDIRYVFKRAGPEFGMTPENWASYAYDLDNKIMQLLVSDDGSGFVQGINQGLKDTANPLDVNTWGSIFCSSIGAGFLARLQLSLADKFIVTEGTLRGYRPLDPDKGFPGAVATIWAEGTFGAILAAHRSNQPLLYRYLLEFIKPMQETDGSFRYATVYDQAYDIGTSKSIAGTAWAVIVVDGRELLWK